MGRSQAEPLQRCPRPPRSSACSWPFTHPRTAAVHSREPRQTLQCSWEVGCVLGHPSHCPWEEMSGRLCQSRCLAAPSGKQLGARSRPHIVSSGTRGDGSASPPQQRCQLPVLTPLLSPQVVPESGARERECHAAQQAGQVRSSRRCCPVLCLAWDPLVTRKQQLLPG